MNVFHDNILTNVYFLGSRIKTSLDFGLVTLDIASLRSSDAGIYTCKAVNMNGEATSTTSIKVQGKYIRDCFRKFFTRQEEFCFDLFEYK